MRQQTKLRSAPVTRCQPQHCGIELGQRDRDEPRGEREHLQSADHLVEFQPDIARRMFREWGIGEVDDVHIEMDDVALGPGSEELERPTRCTPLPRRRPVVSA